MNKVCPATHKVTQIAPGGRYLREDGTYEDHLTADPHPQYRLETDGLVFVARTVVVLPGAGVFNLPAGASLLLIRGQASGGGGGGALNPGPGGVTAAGGGGAGEYGELSIPSPASSYPYTLGLFGAGGGPGAAGAAGAALTIGPGGAILTLQGGLGGPGAGAFLADAAVLGSASAPPSVADFATGVKAGEPGLILGGATFVMGGRGAHSFMGVGADPVINGPGLAGVGPGSGGSGGSFLGVGGSPGGPGALGLIIFEVWR